MASTNLISKMGERAEKAGVKDMFHLFLQDNYRLWFGTYSGNAGDALSGGSNFEEQWSASHGGMQFSTSDKDHDRFLAGNCASENKGGWWFNRYGKQLIPLGCTGWVAVWPRGLASLTAAGGCCVCLPPCTAKPKVFTPQRKAIRLFHYEPKHYSYVHFKKMGQNTCMEANDLQEKEPN